MAYTYNNLPVLSKVKIGTTTYYLKDAEVRTILDTFGDSVTKNVDTAVTADSANLITSGAVSKYVNDKVVELTGGAMNFIGVKNELPASGIQGDVVIVGTAEYVYSDGEWVLFGDEGVYLTIAGAEDKYVQKTLTIAGISLADAITAEEIKTALGLKALAYKDNASGTVTTADGVKDITYTPVGNIAVELNQTSTAVASTGSFTPEGTVSGKTTAAGTVSIAASADGTQITGTVSAPTITVTAPTAPIQPVATLGTLPSYTAAAYTAPSVKEAKSAFATNGLVATVDTEDAEMLVFSAASTADALTGTGFNAGSYTAAEFNAGALPTLGTAVNFVTGATATASAPSFEGGKFAATFSGTETDINANFAGTASIVNVSGNYDKASVKTAEFTGTEATLKAELNTSAKTITVE